MCCSPGGMSSLLPLLLLLAVLVDRCRCSAPPLYSGDNSILKWNNFGTIKEGQTMVVNGALPEANDERRIRIDFLGNDGSIYFVFEVEPNSDDKNVSVRCDESGKSAKFQTADFNGEFSLRIRRWGGIMWPWFNGQAIIPRPLEKSVTSLHIQGSATINNITLRGQDYPHQFETYFNESLGLNQVITAWFTPAIRDQWDLTWWPFVATFTSSSNANSSIIVQNEAAEGGLHVFNDNGYTKVGSIENNAINTIDMFKFKFVLKEDHYEIEFGSEKVVEKIKYNGTKTQIGDNYEGAKSSIYKLEISGDIQLHQIELTDEKTGEKVQQCKPPGGRTRRSTATGEGEEQEEP